VLRARNELVAIVNRCPHLGTGLERSSILAGCILECPAHRWRFDLRSGRLVRHWWNPAGRQRPSARLTLLPVYVSEGRVLVDGSPIRDPYQ
jgi:nitrite reductase/ring-hydroxylating ferredoxin subunit